MAILFALLRIAIRIKFHRRLFADDAFLIFACLTLTALLATVLYYTPNIFFVESTLNGQMQKGSTVASAGVDLRAVILEFQKAQLLRGSLAWLTIFAVKFSFLTFFRQLTDRLPTFFLYWRVVVFINVLAFLYCIGSGLFGCLGSGDETREYWCEP